MTRKSTRSSQENSQEVNANPLTYAYLRASTKKQNVESQRHYIESSKYKIDRWYAEEEGTSGSLRALERPEFLAMRKRLVRGDKVVVSGLDRLGRDVEDILFTIRTFREAGVVPILLDKALGDVDLNSTIGKLMVQVFAMIAEMELNKCKDRSEAGVARARSEGKIFGRSLTMSPDILSQVVIAKKENASYMQLSKQFGINKDTICKMYNEWGERQEGYAAVWNKQQIQKQDKAEKKKTS